MPRPVYMLCCQSGAQDHKTGRLSHFGVYTHISIRDFTDKPARADGRVVVRAVPFRVVAVWDRNPGEPNGEYDAEIRMVLPPNGDEWSMNLGQVEFNDDRLQLSVDLEDLFFAGPGRLRVENRVKHKDEETWHTQSYEIEIYIDGSNRAVSEYV